jgi:receptor protein-tyrosine kinase
MIPRAQSTVLNLMNASKEREARHMGTLLMESGKLKREDVEKISRLHEDSGIRFGEAAIQLGLVSQADVNEVLAQQFEYRYLIPGQSRISSEVIAAYEPFSPAVEELRALRAQLVQRGFGNKGTKRCLAIAGCDKGGGRSYLTANLAAVFSQLGQRTLVIDADMRNPRQHELFGIANHAGLSTILAGRGDVAAVQKIPGLMDLSVLTAGPVPPNPAELLERPALAGLMEQLDSTYDVVLLDTAAIGKNTEACSLIARAGTALIVVHRYRTRVKALNELISVLPGVEILGTVLNEY